MKYIIAVSGGVDSVVLLDRAANGIIGSIDSADDNEYIVAHFDHGIRPESDADARFVWELAKKYGLPCEIRREELGAEASEALARERRYAFLHEIARKYEAKIITAHHEDDLIETISINLSRGTGWRGLAVLGSSDIERPLLGYTKSMIRNYALSHQLEWVEDETNASDRYRRNRVRHKLYGMSMHTRRAVIKLWVNQLKVRTMIEQEQKGVSSQQKASRYFFIMMPDSIALEILRTETTGRLTRPQLRAVLLAIKTFRAGQKFEAGNGIEFTFSLRHFAMKDTSGLI